MIKKLNDLTKIKKMGRMLEEWKAKRLDEGYFKSYPEEVVDKAIAKVFKKHDYRYDLSSDQDLENDFQILFLYVWKKNKTDKKLDERLVKDIENALSVCGWYIGDNDEAGPDQFLLYLEPKYPNENSKASEKSKKIIEKVKTFYHVSFKKFLPKILKNGLVPSNLNRKGFKHPERIYLFTDKRIAKDFVETHKTDLLSFTKEINKRKISGGKISKNKLAAIDAPEKFQDKLADEEPIVAFEVDLFRMMNDGKTVNLYHDNRFNEADLAYFTENTIPLKYINQIRF